MYNTMNRFDLRFEDVGSWLTTQGVKSIHAKSIFHYVYRQHVIEPTLVDTFETKYPDVPLSIHTTLTSKDGTIKMLLKLADGYLIETVLMRYSFGNIVCVTTQVGCNIGCSFCASGLLKRQRQVTAGEMVQQVLTIQAHLQTSEPTSRVSHVVLMGTGEPFDNYDHVIRFTHIITHPHGLALAPKHITISTSGIVPKIR
jgi:23S rRNA (adenine2503-C2)-methyltransferase